MRTPRPLLALLTALALGVIGCAGSAADIGAGGDPTDPATEQTDTDAPIPVEPDGGIGDHGSGARDPSTAPPFGVSAEADGVVAEPHTFCWSGDGAGVCADGFPEPGDELTADARIVVTYPEGQLGAEISPPLADDESAAIDRLPLDVTPETPGIWIVDISDVEPGAHTLWLTWDGPQGDAHAAVDLTVE